MGIRDELSVFTRYHVIIFFTTFFTYAFFHASRKALSNSKDSISLFWTSYDFNETWPAPYVSCNENQMLISYIAIRTPIGAKRQCLTAMIRRAYTLVY